MRPVSVVELVNDLHHCVLELLRMVFRRMVLDVVRVHVVEVFGR
jgi:hypothetical protein